MSVRNLEASRRFEVNCDFEKWNSWHRRAWLGTFIDTRMSWKVVGSFKSVRVGAHALMTQYEL